MPLLMCPNCNQSMREVVRNGVHIDMCPVCRGVWLDRGELEKIVTPLRQAATDLEAERTELARARESFDRDPEAWRREHPGAGDPPPRRRARDDDDDDNDDWGDRRRGGRRRGGLFDLFDIFD